MSLVNSRSENGRVLSEKVYDVVTSSWWCSVPKQRSGLWFQEVRISHFSPRYVCFVYPSLCIIWVNERRYSRLTWFHQSVIYLISTYLLINISWVLSRSVYFSSCNLNLCVILHTTIVPFVVGCHVNEM